jgi:hypothetical protein
MNLNNEPVSTNVVDLTAVNDVVVIDTAALTDMVHYAASHSYWQGIHDALIYSAFGVGMCLAVAFVAYAWVDMVKGRKRGADDAWRHGRAVRSTSNPYALAVLKGEF